MVLLRSLVPLLRGGALASAMGGVCYESERTHPFAPLKRGAARSGAFFYSLINNPKQ